MSRILPILFNTGMVRAILDGRKTVTRRIMKQQLSDDCPVCDFIHNEYVYDSLAQNIYCARCGTPLHPEIKAQYHPGDILYVRESYSHNYFDYNTGWENKHAYKADYEAVRGEIPEPKWTPSIHMPKESARIWLKVTAVRAERLQDITEEQAKAEGFVDRKHFIDTFLKLYPACSLETWVWVYEFERCEKPEEDFTRIKEV